MPASSNTSSLPSGRRDRLTPESGDLISADRGLYSGELEQTSFDHLRLGGEWTTRRRTISESEIALYAAVAGDFSPLSVDASAGNGRLAPPALIVAMAVGLGSMDMPIPQVATWEWLSWRFPKAVKAGDTIYARWTLTQKRPPVGRSQTAIAVWRVDVHKADGELCAEGEVGASVFRAPAEGAHRTEQPPPSSRRRRRRRTSTGEGQTPAGAAAVPVQATPAAQPERSGGTRRRRRRRASGTSVGPNGESSEGGEPAKDALPPVLSPAPAEGTQARPSALSRVIKRLRRT